MYKYIIAIIITILGVVLFSLSQQNQQTLPSYIAFGNGRLESTQIDISSKVYGRVLEVYVQEGDIVQKGQAIAKLDTTELNAQLKEALAYVNQAKQNKIYAQAIVKQKESELSLALKNYNRSNELYKNKSIALIELQNDETALQTAKASLLAVKANVTSAQASIDAANAKVETIKVNIDESTLYSPIKGRVLYKIVQNGEIVSNGGKVVILLDLMDTYMSVFLPTSQAGLVDIGSSAKIILDAIPNIAIPSKVTFVSPLAQFTPKEIETQTEREKLMFKVKVKIDSKLLEKYFNKIKTGLPGIAYVKLDDKSSWPSNLDNFPKLNNLDK